jgi:hypothetical protein
MRVVVASTKTAKILLKQGFKVIDIAPHKANPHRTVFIFEKTKELEDYIKSNNLEV